MLNRAAAIGIGMLAAATAALAQTAAPEPSPPAAVPAPPAPDGDDARFSFNRVKDGYLRLDSRTGQVALCSRRQVGWACQVLPDDRIVLESEITRLQIENGKLKKELLSHGLALPSGVTAPAPKAKVKEDSSPPAESKLDRVMNAVAEMWQRLVEMIANLTRDVMKKD